MKAEQNLQPLLQSGIAVPENLEGGLDLGQLFGALRRKLLLVVGITAAVTGAAGLKAMTDTPVYNARLEILVQSSTAESEVVSSVPGTLTNEQSSGAAKPQTVTADLLRILTSPKVLVPVFEKLRAEHPEICRQPSPQPSDASSPSPANSPTNSSANPSANSSVQSEAGDTSNDPCYKAVTRRLEVAAVGKESNIVQATYEGADAEEVQTMLKLVSEAYLKYSLDSRQLDISRAIKFVDTKLPDLRGRVTNLQAALQQLRIRNNLIDPESRGDQLSGQVNSFSQQQLDAQIELEQVRSLYADLQGQLRQSNETAASSALSENPRYQAVLNQLLELDAKIAATSSVFLETTPDMQVLLEQRQKLLDILAREGSQAQKEVLKKIQGLEVRQQSLQKTLNDLNSDVRTLSGVSREYTDIQRELQIATDTLNQFLAKQQALQIETAQREVPWEVLTPPTLPQPIASSLSQNLILGAILGLLLGIGAALALDRLTEIIYTPEALKRIIKLPILGTIPYNHSLEQRRRNRLQRFSPFRSTPSHEPFNPTPRLERSDPFFEAFRTLYTNTRLLNSDDPVRSVVISSTAPGEGKSTVAAYLAQAAAAMAQRVLLVDTNLRFPQLHEHLNLTNDRGLIDVLSGDLDLSAALQRSPLEPNLYVLTAGSIPPDPTRSLSSQKMQRLMEYIQKNFDLVIYDTPPLLGFADAYIVAAQTSGVILVTEIGKLKRSLLEQMLEQLRVSSTPVLGVVIQKS
jgi:polysaccharide biosynthesis transport protein